MNEGQRSAEKKAPEGDIEAGAGTAENAFTRMLPSAQKKDMYIQIVKDPSPLKKKTPVASECALQSPKSDRPREILNTGMPLARGRSGDR